MSGWGKVVVDVVDVVDVVVDAQTSGMLFERVFDSTSLPQKDENSDRDRGDSAAAETPQKAGERRPQCATEQSERKKKKKKKKRTKADPRVKSQSPSSSSVSCRRTVVAAVAVAGVVVAVVVGVECLPHSRRRP